MENIISLFSHASFSAEGDSNFVMGSICMGAIILKKDGREFIIDSESSYFNEGENGFTDVDVKLAPIEDSMDNFTECNFDLREEDLNDLDEATIYLGEEDVVLEVKNLVLNFVDDNRAPINLINEINCTLEKN